MANRSTAGSIDEYIAELPRETQRVLQELRALIKASAPDATETISYQMPAFRAHGRILVWMGAFRDHCSLFPGSMALIDAHRDELAGYRIAKGTIQFRPDKLLPPAVVEKIVKARLAENAARSRR